MKESIKNFFAKKESYYEPDKDTEKKKKKELPLDELKRLRKENEVLKGKLTKAMTEKFKTRRSIRKFSSREVSWELIYNIIEGALNAPAAGNIQNYWAIVIKDVKKRHELGKMAFQQYWLADAPVLIVVVRDDFHISQMYPEEGPTYSIQNSAAFIENLLLLAHFNDLGACWVEAYDNEVIKEFLGVSMDKTVDAIIPIGYPLENPKISKEPLVSKIFYESFGNKRRK